MKRKGNAGIYWFLTAVYMAAIFYVSSIQSFRLPALPANTDKLIHALIYMPLAFLLYLSLIKSGLRRYTMIIAFLFAGLYGISDEFHQSFVPGRISSSGDIIADFIGAFLGSLGASLIK